MQVLNKNKTQISIIFKAIIIASILFLAVPANAITRYHTWTLGSSDDFYWDEGESLWGLGVDGTSDEARLVLGSNEEGDEAMVHVKKNYKGAYGTLVSMPWDRWDLNAYGGHPSSSRALLFGGERYKDENGGKEYLNDVWEYYARWDIAYYHYGRKMQPTGTPPTGRSHHAACYAAYDDRLMYIQGGVNETGVLNELWKLTYFGPNDAMWNKVNGLNFLPYLQDHTAVFAKYDVVVSPGQDPVTKKEIYFFGGKNQNGELQNKLYKYDLSAQTVTTVEVSGTQPAPMFGHMAVWDSDLTTAVMWVFGGKTASGYSNKLWKFYAETATWEEVAAINPPQARAFGAMGYNLMTRRLYVYGGTSADGPLTDIFHFNTIYEPTEIPAWADYGSQPYAISTDVAPDRYGGAFAFCDLTYRDTQVRSQFLLIGGVSADEEITDNFFSVFHYNQAGDWRWGYRHDTYGYSDGRFGHSIFVDTVTENAVQLYRNIVLLNGLTDNGTLEATSRIGYGYRTGGSAYMYEAKWYSGATPTGPQISPRYYSSAIEYPTLKNAIVYGGVETDGTVKCDLYEVASNSYYNGRISATLRTSLLPYKYGHSAVYSYYNEAEAMLIFGGNNESHQPTNDVWRVRIRKIGNDYNITKEQLSPTSPLPASRVHHAAAWDIRREKMLVYGGMDGTGNALGDLWAFDPKTESWEEIVSAEGGDPGPRYRHSAVWDNVYDRMIVYGGQRGTNEADYLGDMWFYYPEENKWVHNDISSHLITARAGHACTWDNEQKVMIIDGGETIIDGERVILNDRFYFMRPETEGRWFSAELENPGNYEFTRISIDGNETTLRGWIYVWIGADLNNDGIIGEGEWLGSNMNLPSDPLYNSSYPTYYQYYFWSAMTEASDDDGKLKYVDGEWVNVALNHNPDYYEITDERQMRAKKIKVRVLLRRNSNEQPAPILDAVKIDYKELDLVEVKVTAESTTAQSGGKAPQGSTTPIARIGVSGAIPGSCSTMEAMTLRCMGSIEAISSVEVYLSQDLNLDLDGKDTSMGWAIPNATTGNCLITFATPETLNASLDNPYYIVAYHIKDNAEAVPGSKVWLQLNQEDIHFTWPGTTEPDANLPFISDPVTITCDPMTVEVEAYEDTSNDERNAARDNEGFTYKFYQGEDDVRLIKLTMRAKDSGNNWENLKLKSVKLKRHSYDNIDISDDIEQIKIYKSDNSGLFQPAPFYHVGTGKFGTFEAKATINIKDDKPQYITNELQTYYIVCDIDSHADFDPNGLIPNLMSFEIECEMETFDFTDNTAFGSMETVTLPAFSGEIEILPTFDTLMQYDRKIQPPNASCMQGTTNFIVGGVTFTVPSNEATISSLDLEFIGNANQIYDIDAIKIYTGSRETGELFECITTAEGFDVTRKKSITFPGGLDVKEGNNVTLFVTYDIDPVAEPLNTVGLKLTTLEVVYPDSFDLPAWPLTYDLVTIQDSPDTLMVSVEGVPNVDPKTNHDVRMAKIKLVADNDHVKLERIIVNMLGTAEYGPDIYEARLVDEDGATISEGIFQNGDELHFLFMDQWPQVLDITVEARTFYVEYTIAAEGTPGSTIGVFIDKNSFVLKQPTQDIVADFADYTTDPLMSIRDSLAPDIPTIDVITEIVDWYSNDSTQIAFNWSTNVEESTLTRVEYSIWLGHPDNEYIVKLATIEAVPGETSGLVEVPCSLSNGQRYYIQVVAYSMYDGTTYDSAVAITDPPTFVDVKKPTTPGRPWVYEPAGMDDGISVNLSENVIDFTVSWEGSTDYFDDGSEGSGVYEYVLEERLDTCPVWRQLALDTQLSTTHTIDRLSSDSVLAMTELPESISYRVYTRDWAGNKSNFSELSKNVILGEIEEIINLISNYPNPFRSEEEETVITFMLGSGNPLDHYDVTLEIFDLFGNRVLTIDRPNTPGGTFTQAWDGKNSLGNYVAKGGYICRISVKKDNTTVIKYRKIGVIH